MSATSSSGEISIAHHLDADVCGAEDKELRSLLATSFPHEICLLTRRYVHEVPAHRWLVRAPSGELIAQIAVHDKTISVDGRDLRIGGIAEVCVAIQFRGQGLVGKTLTEAHAWMRREGIPFGMLFGHPKVYTSSGYVVIENPMLANNVPIHHADPDGGRAMIHAITARPWPAGLVDLRGPTF